MRRSSGGPGPAGSVAQSPSFQARRRSASRRLSDPGHHASWISALNRIRAALGDHVSDPVAASARSVMSGRPLGAQGKPREALVVARAAHQPAAVVIDDHQ